MIQADDEVGKVAAATPVVLGRAVELFLEALVKASVAETEKRSTTNKKVTAYALKRAVLDTKEYDFCTDVVAAVADPIEKDESSSSKKKKKKRSSTKGKGKGKKRAKDSDDDFGSGVSEDDEQEGEDAEEEEEDYDEEEEGEAEYKAKPSKRRRVIADDQAPAGDSAPAQQAPVAQEEVKKADDDEYDE